MKAVYDLLERRIGKYTVRIGLYLGCWMIGGYVENGILGFEIGPLGIDWEYEVPTEATGRRSKRPCRLTIQPLKTVVRFKLNLRIWRIGYLMSAPNDHGFYFGPYYLQIEYVGPRTLP
ncbi:hypothetical protein AB4097_20675 [Microvirga sp. 2MCAF35]|uniref:hypothetical protein n=1 Tax=Microvirga sp. 2MCAF35 TaxID=3232987 RepID=UPI003F9D43F3